MGQGYFQGQIQSLGEGHIQGDGCGQGQCLWGCICLRQMVNVCVCVCVVCVCVVASGFARCLC